MNKYIKEIVDIWITDLFLAPCPATQNVFNRRVYEKVEKLGSEYTEDCVKAIIKKEVKHWERSR